MTQNIYDDPDFLAGYRRLPRSIHGLAGAPEWPSLESFLPELDGACVLDLGCGFGWFCRWAAEAGAASVVGLDVSEAMLVQAGAATRDDRIVYLHQDLEHPDLTFDPFDLAYSSLTLHYVVDLDRLLRRVYDALRAGGAFVFSVEHPIFTAPSAPGFVSGDTGRRTWPLDDYLREGPRSTYWLGTNVIKQHRTIGTYVAALLSAGFTVNHLEEWGPSPLQIAEHPEWTDELHRPPFLLLRADRRD